MVATRIWWTSVAIMAGTVLTTLVLDCYLFLFTREETISDKLREHPTWFTNTLGLFLLGVGVLGIHLFVYPRFLTRKGKRNLASNYPTRVRPQRQPDGFLDLRPYREGSD